jgi:acetoin utilization deacetylase AcuC-like enzyme
MHACINIKHTHTVQPRSKRDWECPERIVAIMEVLTDAKLFRPFEIEINCSFEKASVEALARVHTNEYIRSVNIQTVLASTYNIVHLHCCLVLVRHTIGLVQLYTALV